MMRFDGFNDPGERGRPVTWSFSRDLLVRNHRTA
jgi:hypothetical protein